MYQNLLASVFVNKHKEKVSKINILSKLNSYWIAIKGTFDNALLLTYLSFSIYTVSFLYLLIIWHLWLQYSAYGYKLSQLQDGVRMGQSLTKHKWKWHWQTSSCLNQIEQFLKVESSCGTTCMVLLACLWATKVIDFLGSFTCFWFLKRFLRQKVMYHKFDGSEKPLRDSYNWLGKKALALFRSDLKNLNSSTFCSSAHN